MGPPIALPVLEGWEAIPILEEALAETDWIRLLDAAANALLEEVAAVESVAAALGPLALVADKVLVTIELI